MISAQARTETNAERLHTVQIALLLLSRDIEQVVNRPILDASGHEEAAFIGTTTNFSFTHTGLADSIGTSALSTLQRTSYYGDSDGLWRMSWDALDRAPQSQPQRRHLLADATGIQFQYLGQDGHFYDNWPLTATGQATPQPIPQAVRIYLTLPSWGTMSQLYVIPIQISNPTTPPPPAAQHS